MRPIRDQPSEAGSMQPTLRHVLLQSARRERFRSASPSSFAGNINPNHHLIVRSSHGVITRRRQNSPAEMPP